MKRYKGAVFFVDILGMGALTRGQIELSTEDFIQRKITAPKDQNEHVFSALTLIVFRKVLNGVRIQNKNIKVAQLSDCAFIWGAIPKDVLNAAIQCMWNTTRNGIFCRGGMAYGNIIEPNLVNNRLGKFILGDAVTKAVDMERSGKGCRIFSDVDLPSKVSGKPYPLYEAFVGLKNPADCSIVDEFLWYMFRWNKGCSSIESEFNAKNVSEGIMEIISRLFYCPSFNWNASTKHGAVHLATSIETLSNALKGIKGAPDFNFLSEYTINNLKENRSTNRRKKILSLWKTELLGVGEK